MYEKTWWIRHGSGFIPYLPWYFNSFIMFYNKLKNKLSNHQVNNSSGSDWNKILKTEYAKELADCYNEEFKYYCKDLFNKDFDYDIINNKDLTIRQKRMIIQLGYQLSKLNIKDI